jgi:hypothetical protein
MIAHFDSRIVDPARNCNLSAAAALAADTVDYNADLAMRSSQSFWDPQQMIAAKIVST